MNVTTSGTQSLWGNWADNSVAMADNGSYVVVWQSSGNAIARVFAADGTPLSGEIQVNTTTTNVGNNLKGPAVAIDSTGNFVVVFNGSGAADDNGVYARRFQANGTPLGTEFLVNVASTDAQYTPSIGMASNGVFVIAWTNSNPNLGTDIYAQKFAANGTKSGKQLVVSADRKINELGNSVAVDSNGSFVVGWGDDFSSPGTTPQHFQKFDSTGKKLGSLITPTATGSGIDLAFDGSGNVVAIWEQYIGGSVDTGCHIFGQRFGSSGQPLEAAFQVSDAATPTYWGQTHGHAVTADQAGDIVVAWTVFVYDPAGNDLNVAARRYQGGTSLTPEPIVNVNTTVAGPQMRAATAMSRDGTHSVVVWSGAGTADDSGVFMQRYLGGLAPVAAAIPVATGSTTLQTAATQPAAGHQGVRDRIDALAVVLQESEVGELLNLDQVAGGVAAAANGAADRFTKLVDDVLLQTGDQGAGAWLEGL